MWVLKKRLEKYLRSRAVRGPWQIQGNSRQDFKAAIIIPALAERASLQKTLASLVSNPPFTLRQTLVVVVVNNRSLCPDHQFQDNQKTLRWLQTNSFSALNLAWVDASSSGFELPHKDGVGLARKIGFDLALARLDWLQNPLLISLDADTLVDENYLPAILDHFSEKSSGGATLPFHHQSAPDLSQEQAIRYYELYLRTYLFGLQQAGSPYAYHSIGSAFACCAADYLAVGGMSRRQAGEDFYFLQQLAKHSGVEMLSGTLVQPSPRFSSRVSFGTGKAVQAQVEQQRQLFHFCPAAAFSVLRLWLQLIETSSGLRAEDILLQADGLSGRLGDFLRELGFGESWVKLQLNYADEKQRCQAFHCWFDGLRTRQLLSCLAEDDERPVEAVVAEVLDWGGYPGVSGVLSQLHLLESLQGVEN